MAFPQAAALLLLGAFALGCVDLARPVGLPNGFSDADARPIEDATADHQDVAPPGLDVARVDALGSEGVVDAGPGDVPMNQPPTVAIAAKASSAPVTATMTTLSVLGDDDQTEAALIYTWSTAGTPPGPVTFSANGSNAAKSSAATFTTVGTYTFTVTIQDGGGAATSSATTVTVVQTLNDVVVSPSMLTLVAGATQQFSANSFDQFGAPVGAQPPLTWRLTGACGTLSPAGLLTAGFGAAASCTVTATSGTASDTASVTVGSSGPVVVAPSADSYVEESNPDKFQGSSPSLLVKKPTAASNTRYAFFKFSLAGLTGPPSKATFRLHGASGGSTTTDSVVAISDVAWTESTITWRTKPVLGARLASSEVTTTAKYREWDLTSYVRAQQTLARTQISIALVMDTLSTDVPDRFNSREAISNPPQLVLTP